MPLLMEKIRVGLFMDSEVRDALKSEAAERGMEMSDLAEEILRETLAEALDRIHKKRHDGGRRKKDSP